MAKGLASFSISHGGDAYVLHLEDEDGETADFTASYDQLDLIAEAIDEALNRDEEEALGLEEAEEEE